MIDKPGLSVLFVALSRLGSELPAASPSCRHPDYEVEV